MLKTAREVHRDTHSEPNPCEQYLLSLSPYVPSFSLSDPPPDFSKHRPAKRLCSFHVWLASFGSSCHNCFVLGTLFCNGGGGTRVHACQLIPNPVCTYILWKQVTHWQCLQLVTHTVTKQPISNLLSGMTGTYTATNSNPDAWVSLSDSM